jgi:hypothetical protein
MLISEVGKRMQCKPISAVLVLDILSIAEAAIIVSDVGKRRMHRMSGTILGGAGERMQRKPIMVVLISDILIIAAASIIVSNVGKIRILLHICGPILGAILV